MAPLPCSARPNDHRMAHAGPTTRIPGQCGQPVPRGPGPHTTPVAYQCVPQHGTLSVARTAHRGAAGGPLSLSVVRPAFLLVKVVSREGGRKEQFCGPEWEADPTPHQCSGLPGEKGRGGGGGTITSGVGVPAAMSGPTPFWVCGADAGGGAVTPVSEGGGGRGDPGSCGMRGPAARFRARDGERSLVRRRTMTARCSNADSLAARVHRAGTPSPIVQRVTDGARRVADGG